MCLPGALARTAEPLSHMSRCVAHDEAGANAPARNPARPRMCATMVVVADVTAWCSILITQDTIAT